MFGILTKGDVIRGLEIAKDDSQFRRIRDDIEFVVNSVYNDKLEYTRESIDQKEQQFRQWHDEIIKALDSVTNFIKKPRIKTKITNNRDFVNLREECERCLAEIWMGLTNLLGMAKRRVGNWKYKYDYTAAENYKIRANQNHAKLSEKITRLIDLVSKI